MSNRIYIGTSGWSYKHWRGVFYPQDLPEKEWFAFYRKSFDTVEINNTFYRQPPKKTFQAWREQAPRGFRYAVKANRYLTHLRKLHDASAPLDKFLKGAKQLEPFLGPLLYQLPPHWKKNLKRLEAFARLLPDNLQHAIEFRDRDWLAEDTYALLSQYNLSLCVHDLLPRHPRRVTGKIAYVRFHGAGKKYAGKYSPSRLKSWAKWIESVSQEVEVFAYFNNDAEGQAIQDARALREML
jgi:uncharacterized protein YecE (DUF72 family)